MPQHATPHESPRRNDGRSSAFAEKATVWAGGDRTGRPGEGALRSDPAAANRARKRRLSLLKGLLLLALLGIGFATIIVWQRDTTQIRIAVEGLAPFKHTVQSALDQSPSRRLPLKFPATDPVGAPLPDIGFTYLPIQDILGLRHLEGPVLVGYSRGYGNGLRSNGRAVLIVEHATCDARWLTNAEFARWTKRQQEWLESRRDRLLHGKPRLP